MSMERKIVKPRIFMAVISLIIVSTPPGILFFIAISEGGEGGFSFYQILIFLLIFLICAIPGIYAVFRSTTSSAALKNNNLEKAEKDSNLVRRYFIVSLVWALMTILLMVKTMPSRKSDRIRAFDSMAKSELKDLAVAQEEYYSDHGIYTSSLKEMVGFNHDERITVTITHADKERWAGTAKHEGSATVFLYDSKRGGIQK